MSHGDTAFHIVNPRSRDRYEVPPGVEARYATISLRAEGAGEDAPVRWLVDGRPTSNRWRLTPGRHTVRAISARGRIDEVTIEVRDAGAP
jgi:membrane carboxypeptidase/penicillin-binding protein PbpC